MSNERRVLANAVGLHQRIAADVAPHGGTLDCDACGQSVTITREQWGAYLATDWPKCCGHTMKLTVSR